MRISDFANSSRFCVSVTNVVMALKIFTLLFPEVVTEKVSALILAISINIASNNVEKSPFPVELYRCDNVCSGLSLGTEAGK